MPISWGLNSQLIKEKGNVREKVWKVGGMYGQAIEHIVFWLEKAMSVAENPAQKTALSKLVEYYKTGDLKKFDEYNILWVQDTESVFDVINGFIETYQDPMGYRGTFQALVQLTDFEATRRIAAIGSQAQWFEDNSPVMEAHKKPNVTGISARVANIVVGSGRVSPSSPIGINLPNANWIRTEYGSKSVTFGNLIRAYAEASKAYGELKEFTLRPEDIALAEELGTITNDLHVDLHEVIGHASGRLNPGVPPPNETLRNYAATLEEARAELVALYYLPDPKLVEIGVSPSTDVGKVAYHQYIAIGLMLQLKPIKKGEDIEGAHMRSKQLIAAWAFEQGAPDSVIEKIVSGGKTYFVVNDYDKLRELFGQLLREIQRIKSEGDYAAARNLVEKYGVKVDQQIRDEVEKRYAKLDIAHYSGFINPVLKPVIDDGQIVDVEINFPDDFAEQMLFYADNYSLLPTYN